MLRDFYTSCCTFLCFFFFDPHYHSLMKRARYTSISLGKGIETQGIEGLTQHLVVAGDMGLVWGDGN